MADGQKPPQGETRQRGVLSINLDHKSILFVAGVIGIIVPTVAGVLKNRQNVEKNTARLDNYESRLETLEEAKRRGDNALLLYCSSRKAASDSARMYLPDIGC